MSVVHLKISTCSSSLVVSALVSRAPERSGFEPWPGHCCVLEQETLLSQCLSPPRETRRTKCGDGLASHPGGVAILLVASNLVPRVVRLLGQRFGRQERLWGNGIFSIFLIGYSGNNEIGEAEVGLMLTLPSIMSRTSKETSAIFQRGQQVTLLVRDWRISIHLQHLLVSVFG